jgi:hypothetical protein
VPLSDEEARLLHQLEQSLAAEDPDFASTLRGSKFMAHNRRIAILAVLGFIGGLVLLFAGAVSAMTWLGVVGFVAMLATAYLFMNAWKRGIGRSSEEPARSSGKPAKPTGTFVDRMEERWQRRRDGDER